VAPTSRPRRFLGAYAGPEALTLHAIAAYYEQLAPLALAERRGTARVMAVDNEQYVACIAGGAQ
jgi:hypothetical protein